MHPLILTAHFILTAIVAILTLCSCSHEAADRTTSDIGRLESLRKEAIDAYMRDSIWKSDSIGDLLYKEAIGEGNEMYEAYGLLIRGLYPRSSSNADKRLQLVKLAEKKALSIGNDTLLSWVYNVLGIYSTSYDFNFSEARHYYTEAIKYAKRGNVNHFRISAECNISELYYTFGDTLGIKYDLDIYKYSKDTDNPHLIIASARRIAEYYICKKGMESQALPYIEDIKVAGNTYQSNLIKGKYYHAIDSLDKAKAHFEAALRHDTVTPNVYLSYARLLNACGEYSRSNSYLDTAYNSFKEIDEHGFDYIETMRLFSDNMRHLGNDSQALKYLEHYISARDSVNNLRNREEINSYKVKFDVEKKELELDRNLETMRRQRITIWGGCAIVTLCIGFFTIYTYRKRRMYKLIVRQHRDFLMQSQHRAASAADDHGDTDSPTASEIKHTSVADETATIPMPDEAQTRNGLSMEKADAIWHSIMHEMDDNRIYTDANLTRDSFSERIGCNHTWFSQVIKERTGKSYLQFMNSRRVNEAIKILSDPESDIPIKSLVYSLGFTSISTFYSAFRQQVGMSPAEFRKISLKN